MIRTLPRTNILATIVVVALCSAAPKSEAFSSAASRMVGRVHGKTHLDLAVASKRSSSQDAAPYYRTSRLSLYHQGGQRLSARDHCRGNNAMRRHDSRSIMRTGSTFPTTTTTSSTSLSISSLVDPVVLRAGIGATAKLLSSIALGGLAATKRVNVLDASAVSALSRLTYWVFQPAFLLCSVSRTFVGASASSLTTSAGSASGGLPGQYLALMPLVAALQIAMGALVGKIVCKIGNINDDTGEQSQVQMCTTFGNSGPLPLIFSEALFKGSLFSDVAACISFYLLVWSPLFWSFGRVILGTYNKSNSTAINGEKATAFSKVTDEVKKFLSPPVVGSILGVMIGTIPILRSTFFGGLATPLFGAIATLGTAYLPAALLVLAGSLVGSKPEEAKAAVDASSTTTLPSVKSIVYIFLSRFLVAPSMSFLALTVMSRMGLLGVAGTRARAIVSFCILAEGCMPPAQNSVIMLQLEGLKERATSMAKLLTILYAMGVVPVTILLSICLGKSGILAFQ